MKEFDYTKWDNKPREMWVWVNENHKEKKLVVFIDIEPEKYPVFSWVYEWLIIHTF